MHPTWHRLGIAAVLASSISFAQSGAMPATPSGGSAAAAQPEMISKVTSSVKSAYSDIEQAKGMLNGHSPTKNNSAASVLGKAEHELGTAKSLLPAGAQREATQLIDTAESKVASARTLLHGGHAGEAKQALGEVPPLASIEKSVQSELPGATGIGGSGPGSIPLPGTPPSK